MSDYPHQYFARVIRDRHTGTVMLQLLDLDETVQLDRDGEFITLGTKVNLSDRPS